jgi:branched-chain amino acid transport system permease protein
MGVVATGVYHTDYRGDLSLRHTRAEFIRLAMIAVVLVVLPFFVDAFWLSVLDQIGIAVIAAVGLNILTGYTGQVSLGTGGFLAAGAYTSAFVITRMGLPTPIGIVAAVLVAALVGAFFGLPALRLKGLYLAIATLASQEIIIFVVRTWKAVTGGVDSLNVNPPQIGGFLLYRDFRWYWVIMFFAVASVVVGVNLFRTGTGRALIAIRDQDIAAEVIGVDVGRYKILAFAVAAGLAGLAGALTASWRGIVTWERFTLDVSITYVAMVIIGGLGSISGSVYGAAFIIAVDSYLLRLGQQLQGKNEFITENIPAIRIGMFGLIIVIFLIIEPRGLARLWQRVKDYFRLWPFRY